jgi:SAM-dependent methyltransferase
MLAAYLKRRAMIRAWAAHDADAYRSFVQTITGFTKRPLQDLRVLDLGCGSNAPMTVLLHAAGCRVTGVDARLGHRWGLGFRFGRYGAYLKEVGLAKTLRKAVGELVFDREYYQHLSRVTGLKLSDEGLDLQAMDVQQPTLPEASFDVVHSNATWEHVSDVRAANRALAQALTPGGIAYIEIHLFPSLSGGHDLPWIVPGKTELGDVKPWQHLRDREWRPPVFLNRLRERDYRACFDEVRSLKIEEWKTEFTEGESLLTPEITKELPGYASEELTKRSIIVVARRIG